MRTKAALILPVAASSFISLKTGAQTFFSDTFDTDTSALWTVNKPAANPTGDFATFAFDYSTAGIPAAPGSSTTFGLKLEANVSGGLQTGLSVSPTGLALPNDYVL